MSVASSSHALERTESSGRADHHHRSRPRADAPICDAPSFRSLGVPPKLIATLRSAGIHEPFAIQTSTLADALAGRDVSGKAPTGSGKTLAFSLPMAVRVEDAAPRRPTGLILVPTRELAAQVMATLRPLAQRMGRRTAAVYGGTPIGRDIKRLSSGVDILVACPGRLEDLIARKTCHLDQVGFVVVDEADRMADMGFLPVVRRLLDATRDDRQTLLFSATLDGAVDDLVRRYQRNPVRHEVVADEDEHGEVRHLFFSADRQDRRALTARLVTELGPAIVFTRTKHGADRLAKQLGQSGVGAAAIHGDRSQKQREAALARFSSGAVSTLVATDVAARGIHVDDVALVIHYDMPAETKDYVHRSGRTGRAGSDGVVVAFVGHDEHRNAGKLQQELGVPTGLHVADSALLTSPVVPAPTISTRPVNTEQKQRQRARPNGGKGRPRHGGRAGSRRR